MRLLPLNFEIKRLAGIKTCKAIDLDREENRFVNKFRTDIFGLNRMKIIKHVFPGFLNIFQFYFCSVLLHNIFPEAQETISIIP